ncbi:MAG TPA: type II toxin-antitoxin system prevent-host-death family antitoxin [Anaerolineae bacterium]|nr:type II toxin-antitoxin system prevent-host-death family antitoxin [Anaerolineae bacterium]
MSVLQDSEPQVISATTLRTKTRDILETARFGGGHFIVETFGKPMVAIVGVEQYRHLLELAREREDSAAET